MDASRFDRLIRSLSWRTTRCTALASLALGVFGKTAAQEATPAPEVTPQADDDPVFMVVQTAASGCGEGQRRRRNAHGGRHVRAGWRPMSPA
jgi:hypothetical protein